MKEKKSFVKFLSSVLSSYKNTDRNTCDIEKHIINVKLIIVRISSIELYTFFSIYLIKIKLFYIILFYINMDLKIYYFLFYLIICLLL